MKNIWTIMKKELARVFKDPRLILMVFIIPGLMIYVMYSIMGTSMQNQSESVDKEKAIVYTVNMPESFKSVLNNDSVKDTLKINAEYEAIMMSDLDQRKDMIKSGEADYIIVFSANFDDALLNNGRPSIQTYYNPSEDLSTSINSKMTAAIELYRQTLISDKYGDVSCFDLNLNNNSQIYEEDKAVAKVLSMMLPFLIITFLFSGAMSVGPESIAGDKERGTIATMLITPIKRSELALGKVFSLSILSIISAISSFIGVILSMPKLMGMEASSANIYSFQDYALTLGLLIATVFTILGLIAIVSAFAKNIKEASMLVMPIYILSMLVGISTMFTSGAAESWYLYLIPIYNTVNVLLGIFSLELSMTNYLITIIVNIVFAAGLVFALTKMFNSEKIMFSK